MKHIHKISALIIGISMNMGVAIHSYADVSVKIGKTSIPDGDAIAATDITVRNEKLAFAIAVESPPPWGAARGSIVDIANVLPDGSLSNDRVAFADFIPNNWSSWPTKFQTVKITKNTKEEVIVNSTRDFGEILLVTDYSLKSGSDIISANMTMTNKGKAAEKLLSGFTLWQDGGYRFSLPGYDGVEEGPTKDAISDRFIGYDEEWSIALHAPYMNTLAYYSRDLYKNHTLKAGASTTFQAYYQVIGSGDVSGVVKAEIERKNLDYGTLSGTVKDDSKKYVKKPAVIIATNGAPYIWVIGKDGKYNIDLPVGEYEIYATSKGYSDSKTQKVTITKGNDTTASFKGLGSSGTIVMQVRDKKTGKPLDGKIQIEEGNKPLIEFFGSKTFFTDLTDVGTATFTLAPGAYKLKISHGDNFLTAASSFKVKVSSGKTENPSIKLNVLTQPTTKGWYSGDLHHHANVLEGTTPPEYLVRSQLAAGLSVMFLSDHDSTVNFAEVQKLSNSRDVTFIPSVEISASWGHFNPFPMNLDAKVTIDAGVDDIHTIIDYAKNVGAMAIASNHPYIPYGYFSSLTAGTSAGGFNPEIDFIEINAVSDYKQAIEKARDLWNRGLPYYYTAGSDTHNVWDAVTGLNRMFVYTGSGKPSPESFTQAMKDGHAYVSFGPIIYPKNVMFGDTLRAYKGSKQVISFDLLSVNELKSVQLIGKDGVIKQLALKGNAHTVEFKVPNIDGWVALVVEDSKEMKAFSNPIWLKKVVEADLTASVKTK